MYQKGLAGQDGIRFREQAFPEGFEEPQYLVRTCKPDCVQDHNLASRLPPMASLFHREATRTPPLTPTVGGVDGWCWCHQLVPEGLGRPGSLVFREQAFPEGFEEPQYLVRTCKPDCVQDHKRCLLVADRTCAKLSV